MKNKKKQNEWWRETVVYQIYPRSFMDSNGDGIGDIGGIISKLDYIKETGFETVWISPFFASPQRDFGYDISDYYSPAPEYGSPEDIDLLISEIHSRGMYVIFDMVLNHTSDQHPWFIESRSSRDNPKRNWYVWRDGRGGGDGSKKPPTNWRSQVSGSGWQWDGETKQWYWAAFLPFQPDLNYRNPEVKEAVFSMLRHWLDRGVDGFRLDIIGSIFEDEEFRNSPLSRKLFPDEKNDGMFFRSTCRTQNLPESLEFVKELRALTDEYSNPSRFLVGETFGTTECVSGFCESGGLHTAFAFECAGASFTADSFRKLIAGYEKSFTSPLLPVWAFSNHDRSRRISMLGGDARKAKLNAAFQLTVRGLPFFYFGEEIGMPDSELDHRDSLDSVSFPFKKLPAALFNFADRRVNGALNRDKVRTPMLWNSGRNAGFTDADEAWLPADRRCDVINAELQAGTEDSIYSVFKRFLAFRKESEALRRGGLRLIGRKDLPAEILAYERFDEASAQRLTVVINFSDRKISLPPAAAGPEGGIILISTEASAAGADARNYRLSAFEAAVIGR